MATRDEICATINQYVELLSTHQTDALAELFAEDAVQQEPVGLRTNRGRAQIRAFFEENAAIPFTVSLLGPITVVGNRAAMQVRVQHEQFPDFASTDVFEFDDAGQITSIDVYLDLKAVLPA